MSRGDFLVSVAVLASTAWQVLHITHQERPAMIAWIIVSVALTYYVVGWFLPTRPAPVLPPPPAPLPEGTPMTKSIADYTAEIVEINTANGWHEDERTFGDDCALLHSEVSEAFEAFRKHQDEHIGEELADVLIRLLDTAHRRGIDIESRMIAKLAVNRTRGYKHGGKRV